MDANTRLLRAALLTTAAVAMPLVLFFTGLPASHAAPPAPVAVSQPPQQQAPPQPEPLPPTTATSTSTTVPLTTTTAAPAPDPTDGSPGWEQRWGQAALARMTYPWQRLGWTITFSSGRPDLLGKTIPTTRTIEIYVRRGVPFDKIRHVVAHELGHAIDWTYNDAARRAEWQRLRGIDSSLPWFRWNASDFTSPSGDFAEAFAFWQTATADYSQLAPAPDAAALAALTPLFYPNA